MINVGDLVNCKWVQRVGLVVDKRLSNEGINVSMHTKHILNSYPKVYYVFFSDLGKLGPYHEADLRLEQSITPDLALIDAL